MGPIVDRTRENLCTTDNAIIMARQRLMKSAHALVDKGTSPPALAAKCHAVRSASFVLAENEPFHTAKPEAFVVKTGTGHTSI
jgi:hypothetical protein